MKPHGKVIISTVDRQLYEGAFKKGCEAHKAGFLSPAIYTFNHTHFAGDEYQNAMKEPRSMAAQISQLSFSQPELPSGLDYLADFVTQAEAAALAQQIDARPWRDDLKRRVQHYGYRYDYKARQSRREDYLGPLPNFLHALTQRLSDEGHFKSLPDQVIVNEYLPGQGISAHVDCCPCFGDVIASLSLLSPCLMQLQHISHGAVAALWLEPTSLLILSGPARNDWTHAIPARRSDVMGGQKHPRGRRISLTFREMRFH